MSIRNEWKNSDVSGPFDGLSKQSLMGRADSAYPPGQYFPPFGNKMAEKFPVLKINIGYFFSAELTDSFAPNTEPFWTWHSYLAFLHGKIRNSNSNALQLCGSGQGSSSVSTSIEGSAGA